MARMTSRAMAKLQHQAIAQGLDWNLFKDIIIKYGSEGIAIIKFIIDIGFDPSVVSRLIEKLGIDFIKLLIEWVTHKSTVSSVGSDIIGLFIPFLIKFVLKKVLPPELQPMIDQYGDAIVKWILILLNKTPSSGGDSGLPVVINKISK